MSIVEEGSVLIVGAGVSAPFGVPMGGQMIPNIRKGLLACEDHVDGPSGRFPSELFSYVRSTYQSLKQLWDYPQWGAVFARHDIGGQPNLDALNQDLEKLRKLAKLLNGQTSETIDDFIVENPTYQEILKTCIAVEIAKSTYTYNLDTRILEPIDLSARQVGTGKKPQQRNWIHLLINLVRQAIRTGQLKSGQRVRIISFNYDGILESVLASQFQNTEQKYPDYRDCFEIAHPHGICGDINLAPIKRTEELFNWGQNICVVNEAEVAIPSVLADRAKAKEWIRSASQVYAVGFAFGAPNCELLGLRQSPPGGGRVLHYCNFDGNEGVRLAAEKCKLFKTKLPSNGNHERPISVEDWLYAGYLGEFSA